MITFPPYLKPGDTIAITCPAGYMPLEKAQACIDTLKNWGYTVIADSTLGSNSENYFSGTDEERLAALQTALDSPSIQAILFGRGGYGLGRIIDRIDFGRFERQPKWLIGFSDITVLHAHIYRNYKIATLHAPMAGAFNDGGSQTDAVFSLDRALKGELIHVTAEPHPFNRPGIVEGRLVGGNLALLAHLTGTPSQLKTKGKILFLEDVGEYLYNLDRMLWQLKRSGQLDRLAGLVVGGFTDMKDTTRPFGQQAAEIIRDIVSEYDYPVAYDFPVSHSAPNYALKVGGRYNFGVGETVSLQEIA